MSARLWTEAHRREALRRLYEIAAEQVGAGNESRVAKGCPHESDIGNEDEYTFALRHGLLLNAARIDREVSRIRALAEGRLVRVTTWRGQSGEEYATYAAADADKSHGGCRLTRITRIRKATP